MARRLRSRLRRCTYDRSPILPEFDISVLSSSEVLPATVRRAYRSASCVYTAAAVARAVDRLAVELTVHYQHSNPVCAVLAPRGIVLAGMLMQRMVFPLQLALLQAADAGEWGEVASRTVLLIDAGVDPRHGALTDALLQAGADRVERVVLLAAAGSTQDYGHVALQHGSERLLGSGFELDGYGANLPGVYTYLE